MEFEEGQIFITSDGTRIVVTTAIYISQWFSQIRFKIIGQETLGEIYISSKELELGLLLKEIRLEESLTELE